MKMKEHRDEDGMTFWRGCWNGVACWLQQAFAPSFLEIMLWVMLLGLTVNTYVLLTQKSQEQIAAAWAFGYQKGEETGEQTMMDWNNESYNKNQNLTNDNTALRAENHNIKELQKRIRLLESERALYGWTPKAQERKIPKGKGGRK